MAQGSDLRSTAYRGVKWVAASNYTVQLIRFFTLLVLAGLIGKSEFGLLGIATMVIVVASHFTELGVGQALIWYRGEHPEEDTHAAIDTGFFMVLVMNGVVAVGIYLAAPHIAAFFDEPRAVAVIRVLNISLAFATLTIPARSLIEKSLRFKRAFVPEVVPTFVSSALAIALAAWFHNVWALVIGQITTTGLRLVLYTWAAGWLPRLRFRGQIARSLLGYSFPLLGAALLGSALMVGAPGVVGKLLGTAALGVYNLADRMAAFPFFAIIYVVGRVMFPVYAQIRDDHGALRASSAEAIKLITLASAPVCIGLAAVIPAAELVVYRGKWWDLPAPLAFMMLRSLQRSVGSVAGDIYKATGRPGIIQVFFGVRFVLELIFVSSGALLWGLAGAGLGELVASSLALGMELWAIHRRIGLTVASVLDAVKVPIVGACLAGIAANAAMLALGPEALGLGVGVLAGAAIYLAVIGSLERPMLRHLRDAILGSPAASPAPEPVGGG